MPILLLGVQLNRVLYFIILVREQNIIEQALPEINNSENQQIPHTTRATNPRSKPHA
jgi:hypothetical protein